MVKISRETIEPVYDPTKPVGSLSRAAAISRAKALLGWERRVSLEEGLRQTFAWVSRKVGSERTRSGGGS